MTRLAIMQPTYLPWLGYFGLATMVDTFVFLDDVAFSRRSWQQRNRIKGPAGELLLTVPVEKVPRDTPINQIRVSSGGDFPKSHLRAIEQSYASAPFMAEYWPTLSSLLTSGPTLLADLNIDLIRWMAKEMGIEVRFLRSSSIGVSGRRDAYLVAICQELGATQYVSPPGSKDYLDESVLFEEAGIEVDYIDFQVVEYPQQHGPFLGHMSGIDALLNIGPATADVLSDGLA